MVEKPILILGGGFAGVRAALDLRKRIPGASITLINETPFHTYIPDLYEVATASMKDSRKIDFEKLEGTVNIPLETIFKRKDVKVLEDRVVGVDLEKKQVLTQKHGALEYLYLVIALGSTTSYYNIEGAWEYSHPIKVLEDALNVRNDLVELVSRSSGRNKVKVVIAGGGFTGVELAGALNKVIKRKGKVIILEGSPNLLTGMPEWAQKRAFKKLKRQGVSIKLNCLISKVQKGGILCSNLEKVPYDYLIWTTGVKGAELRSYIRGVELNKKGQIATLGNLSLQNHPEVFVAGDMSGGFPTTAWAAIGEGKIVAKNIQRKINGKPLEDYKVDSPAFIVPIGKYYAITNAFHLRIRGTEAWLMKLYVSFRYLKSILPFFKALGVWLKGVAIAS